MRNAQKWEEEAVEAFVTRLEMVQKAIRQDRQENPNSGRYLQRTEEWIFLIFYQNSGVKSEIQSMM